MASSIVSPDRIKYNDYLGSRQQGENCLLSLYYINLVALKENNNNNYKPQVQIDFKIENGDGSTVATQKLPTPTISYEWSDSSPSNEFSPSYLPRMGENNFNAYLFLYFFRNLG